MRIRHQTLREGHRAQLARIRGEAPPPNPYRPGTQRHFWWQHGADRVRPFVDRILELEA